MFKNLMKNLSRSQKIGLVVLGQVLVVVTLVLLVQGLTKEVNPVEVVGDDKVGAELPQDAQEFIAENIWEVVKSNVAEFNQNDITDAVIREGTYEEREMEDGSVRANFIVDIDSLKQSYTISTGWSKDKRIVYEVVVDCPPIQQMKYPETVCYGMYNNTYSISLYLPYIVNPEGYDVEDDEVLAPNIYIDADEDKKIVEVMVSVCDADKFKQEAMNYLDSIPVDFSDYTIEYNINNINVEC